MCPRNNIHKIYVPTKYSPPFFLLFINNKLTIFIFNVKKILSYSLKYFNQYFFFFFVEMALSLLLETYKVGIYKSLHTTPMITKTISTMNLQSGC